MTKILIFVPEIHFHAPLVMRELFENCDRNGFTFHVVMTPKISKKKKSSSSLRSVIRNTGFLYLTFMVMLRLKYSLYGMLDRVFRNPRHLRNFMSPREVCDLYSIPHQWVASVKSKKCTESVAAYAPDFTICTFFNQILPKALIEIPRQASLNLHPSYLPAYKGMSPVMWMLAEGAESGGVTIHYMTEKIDDGNILLQEKFPIEKTDSFFSTYAKASTIGGRLLCELFLSGKDLPEGTKQPSEGIRTYHSLQKSDFMKLLKNHSMLKM